MVPYLKYLKLLIRIVVSNVFPSLILKASSKSTAQARYCYSVWMRHLITAHANGFTEMPIKVAEFGPGKSIGIGLCAMLCGVNEYYGLDAVKHAFSDRNLQILSELVNMYKRKERIPDETEFPRITPTLEDYSFPSHILTDELLLSSLADDRIERIRHAIISSQTENTDIPEKVEYIAPWSAGDVNLSDVDFVYSQAVLEHIDDLDCAYSVMAGISRDGCYLSHSVDFKSHGAAEKWNGHWACSEAFWKLLRGRRPYWINRQPLSAHLELCRKNGFNILEVKKAEMRSDSIERKRLKHPFESISEEDFTTSGAHILCKS